MSNIIGEFSIWPKRDKRHQGCHGSNCRLTAAAVSRLRSGFEFWHRPTLPTHLGPLVGVKIIGATVRMARNSYNILPEKYQSIYYELYIFNDLPEKSRVECI